ncbi:MAG: hypothetical protein K0R67_217 [Paenibacillus sp.]|jgi:DNA-binding transcriptional MerR regulator|nr:hypothetical protein [Paenibacillus sp.]
MKRVVQMLGIPAVTIRAWENRYGVIEPERTEGGHRLYTDQNIEDLHWLKQQVSEKGLTISLAAQMLKKKREGVDTGFQVKAESFATYNEICEHLYDTLVAFNSEQANAILDRAFAAYPFEEVFHRVLAPIMYRIGDEWESGWVSVALEHFVSNFVYQRFFHYFRLLPTIPSLPRMMAFCPEGEHHQLGLLLFVLFLRKKGIEVLYLGANTPADGIRKIVSDMGISYICLSLTSKERLDETLQSIQGIREQFPRLKFILGGKGFMRIEDSTQFCVLEGTKEVWEDWYRSEFMMSDSIMQH